MLNVHKYVLDLTFLSSVQTVPHRLKAMPIYASLDGAGDLCLYVGEDPGAEIAPEDERFRVLVIGTGNEIHKIDEEQTLFFGSVNQGDLVWHVFLVGPEAEDPLFDPQTSDEPEDLSNEAQLPDTAKANG